MALCAVGVLALLDVALLATPCHACQNCNRSRQARGPSTSPACLRSSGSARDGTWLGFRHYVAKGAATGRAAIGARSSGSSGGTIHAMSAGAGHPRRREHLRSISAATAPRERAAISAMSASSRTISPISSRVARDRAVGAADAGPAISAAACAAGGGLADPEPVERTVLLRALSGYDAPSTRRDSGGWAKADITRIIALATLRSRRPSIARAAAGAGARGAAGIP